MVYFGGRRYKRHFGLDPSVIMLNHCVTFLFAAFWTYLMAMYILQWRIQDLSKGGGVSIEKGGLLYLTG